MKYFISFQKKKGLFLDRTPSITYTPNFNANLVHQFNHQLMNFGYVLNKDVFDALSNCSTEYINTVYTDLITGIKTVIGEGEYSIIYRNFPQSVLELSYTEFAINAILHYWTFGAFRPEDEGYLKREFNIEPVNYKPIKLISQSEFESIFTDIIYSPSSISAFDKEVVDWFIENNYHFDYSKITFKEIAAYVGQRLLDSSKVGILPTKDATNVLRIYSAYSGGDEGLKVNTEFKQPTSKQRKILLFTLEQCYNLEESFKIYREKWLKLLYYLNPMTKENNKKFPNVYKHTKLLRNTPKELRTYNSKVEELIGKKDIKVLDLLQERTGVFMRRIDHTVRLFGYKALEKWLDTTPNLLQLVNTYNHFTDRDKEQAGRGVVLASQAKSEVAVYDALEPLDAKLVAKIKNKLLGKITKNSHNKELSNKKIFIDRCLYYRPLATNNRASSMSLDGKVNGTVEIVPAGKVIRMYIHWEQQNDIDLAAFIITTNNTIERVGWNASPYSGDKAVVFSGDNTGFSDKNAEYIDVSPDLLDKNVEWVITDARIFRGPHNFARYNGGCRAGWMLREFPKANNHWLPETIEHSVVLNSQSRTAILMALHVPTRSIVYLDLSMGMDMVSDVEDAIKMKIYLQNFITLDNGEEEINWEKLNQGHILNVISKNIVNDKEEADLVFDGDSSWESVAKYL